MARTSPGSRCQRASPTVTNAGVYTCPVSDRYDCTSCSLAEAICASGFSCPSITPVWSATKTSARGMGVGLAP